MRNVRDKKHTAEKAQAEWGDSMPNAPTGNKWTGWHSFALIFILAVVVLVGLFMPSVACQWAWVFVAALLLLFALIAGQGITGYWKGLFVDERNRVSLSRFQMVLWSVIVFSAFLTAALYNIHRNPAQDPLGITIPSELLVLLGISTTSLVGSPLVKAPKKQRTANGDEWKAQQDLLAKQGVPGNQVDAVGQIVVNRELKDAKFADMFRGEEVGNAAHLDLAKIQMLYITLAVAIAYAALIWAAFSSVEGKVSALPALSASALALLGISHGGYLTHKGIPLSK